MKKESVSYLCFMSRRVLSKQVNECAKSRVNAALHRVPVVVDQVCNGRIYLKRITYYLQLLTAKAVRQNCFCC